MEHTPKHTELINVVRSLIDRGKLDVTDIADNAVSFELRIDVSKKYFFPEPQFNIAIVELHNGYIVMSFFVMLSGLRQLQMIHDVRTGK